MTHQCGILHQIGHGNQRCKIFETVGGTLDTDLGDNGILVMPADENLPGATCGGGEPGKRVLRPEDNCKKDANKQ